MAKILTIRDPQTGYLIAEEWLRPEEETEAAVARVFRKTLGPDAPEQMVNRSISFSDTKWREDRARDWGSFSFMLVGPKGDPNLEKWRLVMTAISEREPPQPAPHLELPRGKSELNEIRQGRTREAAIPASPKAAPVVGNRVRFVQSIYDPFGELLLVPNGDSVQVELTEVRDTGEKWGNAHIYDIAWDPPQAKKKPKRTPAQRSK
jgi:hypothetical protein